MRIKVERCWGNKFRLTTPCGSREFISHDEGDGWSRKYATEALNVLERVYGYKRQNIRFDHWN